MNEIYVWLNKSLNGFCNGFFGRDSYGEKRIEAIGNDWIVARDEKEQPIFAEFESTKVMLEYLEEWAKDGGNESI